MFRWVTMVTTHLEDFRWGCSIRFWAKGNNKFIFSVSQIHKARMSVKASNIVVVMETSLMMQLRNLKESVTLQPTLNSSLWHSVILAPPFSLVFFVFVHLSSPHYPFTSTLSLICKFTFLSPSLLLSSFSWLLFFIVSLHSVPFSLSPPSLFSPWLAMSHHRKFSLAPPDSLPFQLSAAHLPAWPALWMLSLWWQAPPPATAVYSSRPSYSGLVPLLYSPLPVSSGQVISAVSPPCLVTGSNVSTPKSLLFLVWKHK